MISAGRGAQRRALSTNNKHSEAVSVRMQTMLQTAVTDAVNALAGKSPEKLQPMVSSSLSRRALQRRWPMRDVKSK
jgi:hypothetical protein